MAIYRYQHGDRPLDGYTIQHGLGRGGFGEVYYALSDSGREVALKAVQNYEDIELRGIRHCMNLKHPQLVSIFDIKHSAEQLPFVVMEYVDGPSLREILDTHPDGLGAAKAAFFIKEIAKGITYLHDCGIVHRDLKPHNVFYEQGVVKIGDYSLSKAISTSHRTGHTVTVGTVHYMAPEISMGRYNHTVDIYALGVMLYEMVTGQPPFVGSSMGEVLMQHVAGEVKLDNVEEPFARVIRRALQKEPSDRYPSAQAMVDDLMGHRELENSVASLGPETLTVVAEQAVAFSEAQRQQGNSVEPPPTLAAGVAGVSANANANAKDNKTDQDGAGRATSDGLAGDPPPIGPRKRWGHENWKRNHEFHVRAALDEARQSLNEARWQAHQRINWKLLRMGGGLLFLVWIGWWFARAVVFAPFAAKLVFGLIFLCVLDAGKKLGKRFFDELEKRPLFGPPAAPPPIRPTAHAFYASNGQPAAAVNAAQRNANHDVGREPAHGYGSHAFAAHRRAANSKQAGNGSAGDGNESAAKRAGAKPPPPPPHYFDARFDQLPSEGSPYSRLAALVSCGVLFMGIPVCGLHRFYVGRTASGLLWLLTFGLLGIGQIVDMVMISLGQFKDVNGLPVLNFKQQKAKVMQQPVNDYSAVPHQQWTESRIGFKLGNLLFNLIGGVLLLVSLGLGVLVTLDIPQAIASGAFSEDLAREIARDSIRDWHILATAVLGVASIVAGTTSLVCLIVARRESSWTHMLRLPLAAISYATSIFVLGLPAGHGRVWERGVNFLGDGDGPSSLRLLFDGDFIPTVMFASLFFVVGTFVLAWPARRGQLAGAANQGPVFRHRRRHDHRQPQDQERQTA